MRCMVTGAGGSAGYNVARCLLEAGHYVLGVDTDETMLNLSPAHDRLCCSHGAWPKLVKEHRIDVIVPQPEQDVRRLAYQDWTDDKLPHLLPGGVKMMQEKRQLAQHLGGLAPENWPYSDTDVREALKDHPKLFMRARQGAGAFAALPVHSVEEARFWYEWWRRERDMTPKDFMISEYLPGREFTWQGVLRDGKLLAYFVRERVKRMHRNGYSGTPSVARSSHDPDVIDVANQVVARLGVTQGAIGIDMKERNHGAGDFKVTEVNCRFYTTTLFPRALGMNLPDILVTGIRPNDPMYPADCLWVRQPDAGCKLVRP
jgi:hypothetical protein